MHKVGDFICPSCERAFEADWTFGAEVQCPHCLQKWETDYDVDMDDEIQGPWISGIAVEPKIEGAP